MSRSNADTRYFVAADAGDDTDARCDTRLMKRTVGAMPCSPKVAVSKKSGLLSAAIPLHVLPAYSSDQLLAGRQHARPRKFFARGQSPPSIFLSPTFPSSSTSLPSRLLPVLPSPPCHLDPSSSGPLNPAKRSVGTL